jgi:hypothetical protein
VAHLFDHHSRKGSSFYKPRIPSCSSSFFMTGSAMTGSLDQLCL